MKFKLGLLILLLIALVIGATAASTYQPPPAGAYYMSGGNWTPLPSTTSATVLNYQPPAVALYCLNGSSQWVPADSTCLTAAGSSLPLTGGTLTGPLYLTQGSANALNFNISSDTSDWQAYQTGTGASSTFLLVHAGVVNALSFTNIGALTIPDNFFLNTGKNLFFDTAANGSQWGFTQTGTAGSATFALAHAGVAASINWDASGNTLIQQTISSPVYKTATNCSSSASPAVCGSAAAGSVALPTNASNSSIVVDTTAVTANSQIFAMADDTLGTKLGITCNTTAATLAGGLAITGRTAGTSFTIANNVAVSTNPLCVSYHIIN